MGEMTAGLSLLAVIAFLIVLTILWIVLPFALFGTKPLLRELIAETKKTNAYLAALRTESNVHLEALSGASPPKPTMLCGSCRKPIAAGTPVCPHCGTKLAQLKAT